MEFIVLWGEIGNILNKYVKICNMVDGDKCYREKWSEKWGKSF